MDARRRELEEDRERLLKKLARVDTELAGVNGLFDSVPHYQQIEEAAHRSAEELSRRIQQQSSREVAVQQSAKCDCPWCGREIEIGFIKRTIESADGPVEITEPQGKCPTCRRAFFPSA